MAFDVEKELEIAIQVIGGVRVASLAENVTSFENADFIFPGAKVVAELKCLDEDKIGDEKVIEKASRLYKEEFLAGKAPVLVYGTTRLTTQGFSREYWEKIGALYRVPIERRVKKGDRQIEDTKKALNRPDDAGLLIIANNKHSALTPWHAKYILEAIANSEKYDSINTIAYTSANMQVELPGEEPVFDCWLEVRRKHLPPVSQGFLDSLRMAWYEHLASVRGLPLPTQVRIDAETLARFDNKGHSDSP